MHLNRLLIPKNFLFYLLFLTIALMYIIVVLWGYYHLSEIEHYFNGLSLPFLDLHQSGNVLDWFYSILWIHIAILSIFILGSSIEHGETFFHIVFWINVPLIAFILSADTICSFSTFALQLVELGQINSASKTFSLVVLRFIFIFFVLIEFSLLFHYIRTRSNSRLILTGSVIFCISALFFVFLFGSSVPREALIRRNNEPVLQKFLTEETNPSDTSGLERRDPIDKKSDNPKITENQDKIDENKDPSFNSEPENDPPKEEETSEDDNIFRNAAEEGESGDNLVSKEGKSDSTSEKETPKKSDSHVYKWEDIFGWEKSFEEYWNLSNTVEDKMGISKSIESYLWGNKTPDIPRIRELIHYGGTGLFILLLSLTIQLIARAGRVAVEKKILRQFSNLAAVYELASKS